MKQQIIFFAWAVCTLAACNGNTIAGADSIATAATDSLHFKSGYSDVNGIKMYYEIYGQGKPLILLHGGGSTIQTSFSSLIPLLARHRQVIAVELQAHGAQVTEMQT
jgi:hypothetical protein